MDEYIDRIILSLKKTQDKWKILKPETIPSRDYYCYYTEEIIGHKDCPVTIKIVRCYFPTMRPRYHDFMFTLHVDGKVIEGLTSKNQKDLLEAVTKFLDDKRRRASERRKIEAEKKRKIEAEKSKEALRKLDNCQNL